MTVTPAGSPPFQAEIESVARQLPAGVQEDWRTFASGVVSNLQAAVPGGNLVKAGGASAGSSSPPTGVGFSAAGANGNYTLSITNPSGQGQAPWHEVSYSPVKSFSTEVTTMEPTQATTVNVPDPGSGYFFRIRSSWDKTTWSSYQLAQQSQVSAGLQTSAATADAVTFNQTNFADVSSMAVGASAAITVAGASGPLTNPARQKGPTLSTLPGATIYGVTPGSTQFVGYNGGYILRPTLASVMANDNTIPIGAVSVVDTGAAMLPAVTLVVSNGYIVGATWTGDNGLTAVPVFVVNDATGAGAVIVGTGVTAGKLDGIQVVNAGNGAYSNGPTVTVTGGVGTGTTGGGTQVGGNGGRLTNV